MGGIQFTKGGAHCIYKIVAIVKHFEVRPLLRRFR